jgi:hypothetical protein
MSINMIEKSLVKGCLAPKLSSRGRSNQGSYPSRFFCRTLKVRFPDASQQRSRVPCQVAGAFGYYSFELVEFEDVRPFSPSDVSSQEIVSIAEELARGNNPQADSGQ